MGSNPPTVMPGLVPGIHVFFSDSKQDVDGRDNGVPADFVGGVPRPGHDESIAGQCVTACGSW
jgi:hypothetical protein